MDRQPSALTKLGMCVMACSSTLAIHSSWGDAGSVAFVLAADAALLLLFLCLRAFEQGGRGRDDAKTKAAVWVLTTLLTAMFASGAAPTIMPLVVSAIVFLCLRDVDHVIRTGDMLVKMGFAVVTCNSALGAYDDTRSDDPGSAALVLVSYAALLILTGLFVRAVARAHTGDGDHGQG